MSGSAVPHSSNNIHSTSPIEGRGSNIHFRGIFIPRGPGGSKGALTDPPDSFALKINGFSANVHKLPAAQQGTRSHVYKVDGGWRHDNRPNLVAAVAKTAASTEPSLKGTNEEKFLKEVSGYIRYFRWTRIPISWNFLCLSGGAIDRVWQRSRWAVLGNHARCYGGTASYSDDIPHYQRKEGGGML